MLEFQQIKNQYPKNMRGFERAILREYLQIKTLQAIFESNFADKLAFLGGTALRIIYNNNRFSEDIDLDNFGLSWMEFQEVVNKVQRYLEMEGFDVEVRSIAKGAYRCYLSFPSVLYREGLSPIEGEKILIQLGTYAQGYKYDPDIILLNKFDVFTQIRVTPLDVLLSQKIYTAINRKRPKGRDFYDITYLLGMTKPNMDFIHQKLGVSTAARLREVIAERIEDMDFKYLSRDVAPFILNQNDIKRVENFQEFWNTAELD